MIAVDVAKLNALLPIRGKRGQKVIPPDKMFLEYPEGIRCLLLRKYSLAIGLDEIHYILKGVKVPPEFVTDPYREEAQRIDAQQYYMVATAQDFSAHNDYVRANDIYEELIKQHFPGSHPYERLRIYYSKNNQLDDAIRVCKAFIEMYDYETQFYNVFETSNFKKKPRERSKKCNRFEEWIMKLEAKKQKCL